MAARPRDPHPDTVLVNARVLTVDRAFTVAEALAVKGDRLLAVGPSDRIAAMAGPGTRRLDVGGRSVVPGFVDTHAHLDREGLRRAYPDLQACRSIADVQAVVRRAVTHVPPGEWVVLLPGGQPPYHLAPEQSLAERRFPDRHDLDAVAPDHPVWIRAVFGLWNNTPPFVHVLNSAGLRACGITRDTPPPTSTVEIERDAATSDLTGRVLERHLWPAAEFTILRAAPRFTREVRARGLREAMRLSAAAGTTSVFEGHGVAAEVRELYHEVHDAGEQTVRAYLPLSLPPWRTLGEVEAMLADGAPGAGGRGTGDDWLTVGGVYLQYGGHPEVAAAHQAAWPYTGWAGFTDQCNDPEAYRALCRLAARRRWRVATVGLTAVDAVLSSVGGRGARAPDPGPPLGARPRPGDGAGARLSAPGAAGLRGDDAAVIVRAPVGPGASALRRRPGAPAGAPRLHRRRDPVGAVERQQAVLADVHPLGGGDAPGDGRGRGGRPRPAGERARGAARAHLGRRVHVVRRGPPRQLGAGEAGGPPGALGRSHARAPGRPWACMSSRQSAMASRMLSSAPSTVSPWL